MLKIMIPCSPEKKQLLAKIGVIKESGLDPGHCGLEVTIRLGDLDNPRMLDEYAKNLSRFASGIPLTFHAPFIHGDLSRIDDNFFMSGKGIESLVKSHEFAARINAHLMNVHAHVLYPAKEAKRGSEWLDVFKNNAVRTVVEGLESLKRQPRAVPVSIETMPLCIDWDWTADPDNYLYDACYHPDTMIEIAEAAGCGITLDAAHIVQTFDSSRLLPVARSFGGRLAHVHLSDTGEVLGHPWYGKTTEGLRFGQGRIGKRVAQEFMEYLVEYSQNRDMCATLEIEHNYLHPTELTAAIAETVGLMEECGAPL